MPTTDQAPSAPPSRAPRRPGRLAASSGVLALAVALGVGGSAVLGGRDGTAPPGDGSRILDRSTPIAFRSFDDCAGLLGYFRTHAGRLVTANGLPGQGGLVYPMAMERSAAAADSVGGATATSGAVDTAGGSGTNVQVAGVDEGDLVKRSGDLLLTVADGRLRVARLAGGTVTLLGSLRTDGGTGGGTDAWTPNQLLVDGDTVLMVGSLGGNVRPLDDVRPSAGQLGGLLPFRPVPTQTRIAQVDLSDPAKPVVVRTLDVDGTPTGVRLVDGIARIAVTSDPQGPPMRFPQYGTDTAASQGDLDRAFKAAEKKALAFNRSAVAGSSVDVWLPHYTLTEVRPGGGTDTSKGRLLECNAVSAPESFSGLATVTLLNLDLRSPAGISSWAGAGVVASGSTLYATADHVYLATSPWTDWAALSGRALVDARTKQRTQIHLFDTADSTAPRYVGSGEVPGFLLGQFAMDEYDGRLRVASTDQPQFMVGGPAVDVPAGAPGGVVDDTTVASAEPEQSHSLVSVLQLERNRLTTVGSVDGLGRGEQIRAVRFLGPVGYVVTFRQTDPLYTVDLSVPTRPRVAGELKILGYSAYLHPVGDGLLLGLGQDADSDGRTSGLQLSLFDVRDPANPKRVSTRTVPGAWSDVEGDHHAFTFTDGLALAPYSGYTEQPSEKPLPEDPATGADGSVAGSPGAPVQLFDTGVLAVPLQGDRLGAATRLRPLADGPITLSQQPSPKQDRLMQATPLRTVVSDGYVYTVTPVGIAVHDEAGLDRIGFTSF